MSAAMALRERIFDAVAATIWPGPEALTPDMVTETYRITDVVLAAINQTDDGAATPGPVSGGLPPGPRPEASEVVAGPAPSSPPRRFQLIRHRDVTGVSGTGVIAEGTEWRDGTASLRWYGDHPSTVAWPSVDDIVSVHGHQGATELRWLDDNPDRSVAD